MRRTFGLLLALGAAMPLACSAEEEALLAALAGDCLLDSECDAELVCVFRRCHQPCNSAKDCPLRPDGEHQACIVADKPKRVCQLESETTCKLHSDCPGTLLCGIDGACRSECASDRDCTVGQVCVGATCAYPHELDGQGLLPMADDGPRVGAPCRYHSDCPPALDGKVLRCRASFCTVACLGDDRDCGRFERCSTTGSDPPEPGECVLIGTPGALHCSPKDDYPNEQTIACACPDGTSGTQTCNPDGSSYGPCTVNTMPCILP